MWDAGKFAKSINNFLNKKKNLNKNKNDYMGYW